MNEKLAQSIAVAFHQGLAFRQGLDGGLAQDEGVKWITVHPNGKAHKGQPVKLDAESGEIIGGLGGKEGEWVGRHISELPQRGKQEQHGAQAVMAWEYAKRGETKMPKAVKNGVRVASDDGFLLPKELIAKNPLENRNLVYTAADAERDLALLDKEKLKEVLTPHGEPNEKYIILTDPKSMVEGVRAYYSDWLKGPYALTAKEFEWLVEAELTKQRLDAVASAARAVGFKTADREGMERSDDVNQRTQSKLYELEDAFIDAGYDHNILLTERKAWHNEQLVATNAPKIFVQALQARSKVSPPDRKQLEADLASCSNTKAVNRVASALNLTQYHDVKMSCDTQAAKDVVMATRDVCERYPWMTGIVQRISDVPHKEQLRGVTGGFSYALRQDGGNEIWTNTLDPTERESRDLRNMMSNWWSPRDLNKVSAMGHTQFHEMGHAVEWALAKTLENAVISVSSDRSKDYYGQVSQHIMGVVRSRLVDQGLMPKGDSVDDWEDQISRYGVHYWYAQAHNGEPKTYRYHELFAEAFAELMSCDEPRPAAKILGEVIDEWVGGNLNGFKY